VEGTVNTTVPYVSQAFRSDGDEFERVTQFRYLGRILEENDDDTHASSRQLARGDEMEKSYWKSATQRRDE